MATEKATASATERPAKAKKAPTTKKKKKVRKNVSNGIVYIRASFNNTIVTISDQQGSVISWSSAGAMGFKGSKKSTPFAAQIAAEEAANKAKEHGLRTVEVFVNGPRTGNPFRCLTPR